MQKTEFPRINVPAQPELLTHNVSGLLRQYMRAGEYKLWEFGMLPLAAVSADSESVRAAADKLHAIRDPSLRRTIVDTVRDTNPFLHWRQAREIYDVHPAMTRALAGMGSDTTIPGSVFRRLRHPNPLFITTAGTPVTHADGFPGRIIGFFVTGALSNEYPKTQGCRSEILEPGGGSAGRRSALLLNTHNADANALHAVVASEVLSHDRSQVIELDMCHLTLPMTVDFTLNSLVKEISEGGFRWAQAMLGPVRDGEVDGYLGTMARVVISHLLYACSRTSEIDGGKNDRPPVQRRKGKPRKEPEKPSKMHQVGYRIGAKIEDSLRGVRQEQGSGAPTGRTLPPHIRAAHPHLYRVGPGRKDVEIKFLDPIPVNMKSDDGRTATVHKMS